MLNHSGHFQLFPKVCKDDDFRNRQERVCHSLRRYEDFAYSLHALPSYDCYRQRLFDGVCYKNAILGYSPVDAKTFYS